MILRTGQNLKSRNIVVVYMSIIYFSSFPLDFSGRLFLADRERFVHSVVSRTVHKDQSCTLYRTALSQIHSITSYYVSQKHVKCIRSNLYKNYLDQDSAKSMKRFLKNFEMQDFFQHLHADLQSFQKFYFEQFSYS